MEGYRSDSSIGLPYLMSLVEKEKRANFADLGGPTCLYYRDYENIMKRYVETGTPPPTARLRAYFRSAIRKVVNAGIVSYYLRYRGKNGRDDWRQMAGKGTPFDGLNMCKFEIESDGKMDKSSIRSVFEKYQYLDVHTFSSVVFKAFCNSDPPPLRRDEWNLFDGYQYDVVSESEYQTLLNDEHKQNMVFVLDWLLHTISGGDSTFHEYHMNWLSWLFRYCYKKPSTAII